MGQAPSRARRSRRPMETAMTTENNWPPLIPLDRGHDLPEFPVDALPSWLATFVDKEAEATQTPAGLAGSMTLAVLATACAKRVIVQPGDDWREPVNLFITVALEPGNRKTGVARDVVKPLRTAEISFLADLADKIRDRDVERRSLAKAVDAAEKRAGKAEDAAERKALIEEAQEIAKELEGKPPIVAPRFVADDATPETFARLVSEQGGRIAVISGESDLFELLAGRYSDGAPNIGLFLSGHAGDDVRVDRMGRPPIRVDEPAVTIGISTQPHVVSGLASKPGFRGRGLLDRFLFSIPASPLGTRKLKPEPMPRHVRATYESNIADIFAALGLPDDKEPS